MSRDEKVREILGNYKNEALKAYDRYKKSNKVEDAKFDGDKFVSQLNALYKPRVDEKKLAEFLINWWAINSTTGAKESFSKETAETLAHIIAQKSQEIMSYE